ncbi:TraB/GumN family protein [uncultured Kriegella sp.]|uniref:TraB/GumN family protein n=1 Tax=uncultured Kriegella sp. TaxID=1798910 RepID=UPI0030D84C20|tara:strand:- start:17834 stop:21358 length:3525 start_codon:yes stop_codon:yes gene_type:complete
MAFLNMRSAYILLLFLSPFFGFSQENNSLLWEISGNGLKETSYLYGTMHVSKRIAFRLDDVFYDALDKSEVIALESDPGTWLEEGHGVGLRGYGQGNGFVSKGFYTYPFVIRNPSKKEIGAYLAFEDRRVNSILYRTDAYSQNFEEDTYLDMFIYQAGKKFKKKVVALEDLAESAALVGRASLNAMKPRPDEWLQKKMRLQDPSTILQDAYRNRDIDLLDSIDKAMYTDHYMNNMLYVRNGNMAQKLDSVMRTAKVFTGIGAAHLPGKKGVIALLRNLGYTVKALTSKAGLRGQKLKEKFESSFRENTYAPQGPDDGLFSIDLPHKLYAVSENINTTYISPDLANGSYVMINRIPTFSHLKQDNVYTLDDLDKLLFENIPGKIIEKKRIENAGFSGLDIKNRLKNGDYQRYHIYVTPLEILIFKMGGDGDYVTQHSDTIFNSIHFNKQDGAYAAISSGFQDFKVRMPTYHTFTNRFRNGNRTIQGYDSIADSYFFLRKATLNDFNFIEADTFELKQIQKRFYQNLKLKPVYKPFDGTVLTSSAIIDSSQNKTLHLKTTLKRGDYYLLGVLTSDDSEASLYFDSFQIKEPVYQEKFKAVVDTALFFRTISNVDPPKFVESSSNYFSGKAKPKAYNAFNKKTIYQNKDNEAITVELNKSHDFLMFANIDSVWALRKKLYTRKNFIIHETKESVISKDYYEMQLTLTDTASTRGILIKNVVQGGLLYEVKAQIDTLGPPSRFVSEFFENFRPFDTLIGRSIIGDKTQDFFAALRTNDSIMVDGYPLIKFENKHIDSLEYYISEFEYPDDKKYIQAYLIQKLGTLQKPGTVGFIKDFYVKSYNNSRAQTKILQAVAKKSDGASTKLLLELMGKDLPLVSNTFEIRKIFKPYFDSLPKARKLYPQLMDFSTIEEYKPPIFSLLAKLKAKGLVKPKSYKKYRKQILSDAKIQLKRLSGLSVNASIERKHSAKKSVLEDYAILLYPFIKEKAVSQFFDRLQHVDDHRIQTIYAILLAEDGLPLPKGMLDKLAANNDSRGLLFNRLKSIGKLNLFPSKYRNQCYLAATVLTGSELENEEQDTPVFLDQRPLKYNGKKFTGYYFKTRDQSEYSTNFNMHLLVFEKGKALTTTPFYQNDGLHIEDTDSNEEAMDYATEAFILKDRQRAEVYRPNGYGVYGYHGF